MHEADPLDDSDMRGRVARFIASGEYPNGYYVSAETLLRVIGGVESVAKETRDNVVQAVRGLIVPGGFVDSLKLGVVFGRLLAEMSDTSGVLIIARDIKNLDKVPIVEIRGQSVD